MLFCIKKMFMKLAVITLLFLQTVLAASCPSKTIILSTLSKESTSSPFTNVDVMGGNLDGKIVSHVVDYLHVFVWNNSAAVGNGTSNTTDFISQLRSGAWRGLKVGVESVLRSNYDSFASYNGVDLTSEVASLSYFTFYKDMCQPYNVFDYYDVLITSSYNFTQYVRYYRDGSRRINTRDFVPIPLVPLTVAAVDSAQNLSNSILFDIFGRGGDCKSVFEYDAAMILMLRAFGNLTTNDIKYIENCQGKSIQINRQVFNTAMDATSRHFNIDLNSGSWSLQQVSASLLPSSCHICNSTHCTDLTSFPVADYWVIPNVVMVLIYFGILFSTRRYRKASFRRRLAIPYVPIVIIVREVIEMDLWSRNCKPAMLYVDMICVLWAILIYTFTVIRYYYLKNLYSMVTHFKNHIKILKALSGLKIGIVFTVFVSLLTAMVLSSVGIIMFFDVFESESDRDLVTIGTDAGFLFLACLLGTICILFDLFINRKNIKEKGIRKFFLFDDPFYIRVDLSGMFVILLITILYVILFSAGANGVDQALYFLDWVIMFCVLMLSGGTTLIMELVKKIQFKKRPANTNELKLLLKNAYFHELFQDFSTKEVSLENLLIFDTMTNLMRRSELECSDLLDIENKFIKHNSEFELNISAASRKQFYTLLEKAISKESLNSSQQSIDSTAPLRASLSETVQELPSRGSKILPQNLIDILEETIMHNLSDTYSRLQQTKEFVEWYSIYSIQHSNAVHGSFAIVE